MSGRTSTTLRLLDASSLPNSRLPGNFSLTEKSLSEEDHAELTRAFEEITETFLHSELPPFIASSLASFSHEEIAQLQV